MADSYRGRIQSSSLRDHFSEAVRTALEHHDALQPQPETLGYLVQLLCDFTDRSAAELERPLALVRVTVQRTRPGQRITQLKRIGDDALYLCGFLRERVTRRNIDLGYYGVLGGEAYRRLAETIRRRHEGTRLIGVYNELADDFRLFSDVLSDVYAQSVSDHDVGSLYEKWLRTQSRYLEHKLRESGVVLKRRGGLLN